ARRPPPRERTGVRQHRGRGRAVGAVDALGRVAGRRRRRGLRRRRRTHVGELPAALRGPGAVTFAEFQARSRFDQAELLAFAQGALVADAPAGFAARLPLPPLLMVDRIVEITGEGAR